MSQCEHGHPVELIDDCPRCGAPQCCPWCCEVQSLEDKLELAKDTRAVVDKALRDRRVELAELKELLTLIRDDLRMRSEDGVVDISDFIWMRIDKVLQEKGK